MGNFFTSWKTSFAGGSAMATAIFDLLSTGGLKSPNLGTDLSAILAGLAGLFAKDANVTGGTVRQTSVGVEGPK